MNAAPLRFPAEKQQQQEANENDNSENIKIQYRGRYTENNPKTKNEKLFIRNRALGLHVCADGNDVAVAEADHHVPICENARKYQ